VTEEDEGGNAIEDEGERDEDEEGDENEEEADCKEEGEADGEDGKGDDLSNRPNMSSSCVDENMNGMGIIVTPPF
tara:strand:+ start:987 stop:1211 length:225 start_codon:yes stop_codon:yes gene_type:complete